MNQSHPGNIARLPGGIELAIPWFLPSPRALKDRERILASQYFLVRCSGNSGIGEVWRCRRCKGKHRHFTLFCVERPFSGLAQGLFAYYHTIGTNGAEAFLPPAERARLEAIAKQINPGAADLATSHPNMARQMASGDRDADLGSVALGLLEPIRAEKAADLLRRINMRAGKEILTLPGLVA